MEFIIGISLYIIYALIIVGFDNLMSHLIGPAWTYLIVCEMELMQYEINQWVNIKD